PDVARLLSIPNIHSGLAVGDGVVETDRVPISTSVRDLVPGEPVSWCIRPAQIQVDPNGVLPATVVDAVDLPTVREATLQLAPGRTLVVHDPDLPLHAGDECRVTLPTEAVLVWRGAGQKARKEAPVASGVTV